MNCYSWEEFHGLSSFMGKKLHISFAPWAVVHQHHCWIYHRPQAAAVGLTQHCLWGQRGYNCNDSGHTLYREDR